VITWTPLHRELGLQPRELTREDIEQACAQGVLETADLDWKAQAPAPEKKIDFATDVAAMANSGGGLICLGVREDSATSAASSLVDVDISDQARRNLLQVVSAAVRPRIPGISIDGIPHPDNPSRGTLLVQVEASTSAPHLIEPRGKPDLRAPVRSGAANDYLNEYELSRLYVRRGQWAELSTHRHEDVFADAQNRMSRADGPWVLLSAVPSAPLSIDRELPLTLEERCTIWNQAREESSRILSWEGEEDDQRAPFLANLEPTPENQRPVPGGWMTLTYASEAHATRQYLAVYADGSCVLACQATDMQINFARRERDPLDVGREEVVFAADIETLSVDFLGLVESLAVRLGGPRSFSIRGEITWAREGRHIYLFDQERRGSRRDGQWRAARSTGISNFRGESWDHQTLLGAQNASETAVRISSRILSHFGTTGPFLLRR
jgi:hypothetical protein